jgi:hypothetical protein
MTETMYLKKETQDDGRVQDNIPVYCYTRSLETRRRREGQFNDFLSRLRSIYNVNEWTGMIHEWKDGWMEDWVDG